MPFEYVVGVPSITKTRISLKKNFDLKKKNIFLILSVSKNYLKLFHQ